MKSSTSGSVKFIKMSWEHPTHSIRPLLMDRTSEDISEANVNPHMQKTKLTNQKFVR